MRDIRGDIDRDRALLQRLRRQLADRDLPTFKTWTDQFQVWYETYGELLHELGDPPNVLITLVGGTGAGKSTLINALIGARVLATSNTRACTSAVTEVRFGDVFEARIDFVPMDSWFYEVQAHANELADLRDEAPELGLSAVHGELHKKIVALYPEQIVEAFYADLDVDYLRDAHTLHDVDVSSPKHLNAEEPDDLRTTLQPFVAADGQYWPLVRQVTVTGPFEPLATGARLVDLPGLNDPNPAREAVTSHFLTKSNFVWLVYNMRRSLTREITEILQQRDIFRRLIMDGRYGGLTAIGTAADSIDPEVDSEEFGLDAEDELAIAAARGDSSRSHVVDQLHDLLAHLEAAGGPEMHAVSERLRKRLSEIPSFSVSARDYLDLIGVQRHRQRLFPDLEATGIPALQLHMKRMVEENGPEAHRASIANRVEGLRAEIRYAAARSGRFARARSSVDLGKEVETAAREARRFLGSAVDDVIDRLRADLAANDLAFRERSERALARANTRLSGVLAAWSSIHWGTLRASCRAGGAFHSSTGTYFDLPGDVSGTFFDTVALAWEDYFGERLRATVERSAEGLVTAGSRYRAELAEVLIPVLGTEAGMREQRRAIESAVEQMVQRRSGEVLRRLDGHIRDERITLQQLIDDQVRASMRPALSRAARESGAGMKARILEALRPAAKSAMADLEPVITDRVRSTTDQLSRWIAGEMTKVGAQARQMADQVAGMHIDDAQMATAEAQKALDEVMQTLMEGVPAATESGAA